MLKRIFHKIFNPWITENKSGDKEETTSNVPVSFCSPVSPEDIFNASDDITDFLNKLKNK